jgi:hypothetical protein
MNANRDRATILNMAELKTKKTKASVTAFINDIENETRRTDAKKLLTLMKGATGMRGSMWGDSIVGFGSYHYKSERSAQEGDWPLVGFSPRKTSLTLYVMPGFKQYTALLKKLGKHKTSVGCLYINKLADVDTAVLEEIIKGATAEMQKKHPDYKT